MVRDRVWLMAALMTSASVSPFRSPGPRFSRMRSKVTIVSLMEKPDDGEERGQDGERHLAVGERQGAERDQHVVDAAR